MVLRTAMKVTPIIRHTIAAPDATASGAATKCGEALSVNMTMLCKRNHVLYVPMPVTTMTPHAKNIHIKPPGLPIVSSRYQLTLYAFCAAGKKGKPKIATTIQASLCINLKKVSQQEQQHVHCFMTESLTLFLLMPSSILASSIRG